MPSQYDASTTAESIVQDLASHIADKVVLVTGVSPGGLGAHFVAQIANAQPKLLILAGRTQSKLQATADAISVQTRTLLLDLESLAGARSAAAEVNGWADVPHVDVLVNNAGIMGVPYAKTVDGFERQFAVNHLAPFLFTNLIMPKLLASPSGPRVVNVSSDGHRLSFIRWADIGFQDGKYYNRWRGYGQSKTANMLMAVSLARKLGSRGLVAVSLHPGVILGTNLGAHLDFNVDFQDLTQLDQELGNAEGFHEFRPKSPSCGVATHVVAAFDPSLKDHNGAYLQDSRIADPYVDTVLPYALDAVEADKLWKLSEEMAGQKFEY